MTARYCALCVALWVATAWAAHEVEPNNELGQATAIAFDEPVEGVVHSGDGADCFLLTAPRSGRVTATVAGFPPDCAFQVLALGFGEQAIRCVGWADGAPGRPVSFAFEAKAGCAGTIVVTHNACASFMSRGTWSAVRCSTNGPWYHTPTASGKEDPGPATIGDVPVRPPIRYTLTVAYADSGSPQPAATDDPRPSRLPGDTSQVARNVSGDTRQDPANRSSSPRPPRNTCPVQLPSPPSVTGPEAAGRKRQQVLDWRATCLRRLRAAMDSDALSAANQREYRAQLGKPRPLACAKCGRSGVFRWVGDRWSCPGCRACVMPRELKRADGLTYFEFAARRKLLYLDEMQRICDRAGSLLAGL